MWETFMTRPFHLRGEVRRVGELTTPWPCFMMATTDECATARTADLQGELPKASDALHPNLQATSYPTNL